MSAQGHLRFAVFNRTLNPLVRAVLRSPAHRMLSRRLLVITVTGRRTGRKHSFPVGYKRQGETVRIPVMWPERKRWWRNLRGGAPVSLRLDGRERAAWAEVEGDERTGVSVRAELGATGPAIAGSGSSHT